jgi:hypothetical protein
MNVWQRMTELNRVRDLLVMAGSFTHLDHSMQGIRSLLLQALVTVDLFSEERSLDMWGLLEEEVNRMLTLVNSVKSATRVVDPQVLEVSIGELLPALTNGTTHTSELQIESQNDWPALKGCPELLSKLFETLGNYFAAVLDQSELNFKITGNHQNNMLVLGIHPEVVKQADTFQFTVNEALLVSFFIVAHHGGEIILEKGNPPGLELRLPLADEPVFTVTENDFWLDQILSLYEVQPVA